MEFIPLETQSKKVKKGGKKGSPGKGPKDAEALKVKTNTEMIKAGKGKLQNKMMEKKKVKNKYREVMAKKGKKRRVAPKKKNDEDEDEDESDDDKDKEEEESSKKSQETSEVDEEGSDDDDEGEEEDDEDDEDDEEDENEESMIEKKQENAIREKWKKMDEKKKNRLFVKMKKKIVSEAQVKELHPDIRGVIFPRKKNSRWCWAVFASQEKALAALKKLSKNREVLVNKPNPRDMVDRKREEKMKTIKRKKENRKKLQQMWS